MPRRGVQELIEPDPEVERTLLRRRRERKAEKQNLSEPKLRIPMAEAGEID